MTPSGIEPATYRFVAQCLNHYATARPISISILHYINPILFKKFVLTLLELLCIHVCSQSTQNGRNQPDMPPVTHSLQCIVNIISVPQDFK